MYLVLKDFDIIGPCDFNQLKCSRNKHTKTPKKTSTNKKDRDKKG